MQISTLVDSDEKLFTFRKSDTISSWNDVDWEKQIFGRLIIPADLRVLARSDYYRNESNRKSKTDGIVRSS